MTAKCTYIPEPRDPHGCDIPDDLPFDEAKCAEQDCLAPIGAVLYMDAETGYDRGRWIDAWRRPEDGKPVCEDCAIWIEEGRPAEDRSC